MVVFFLMTRLPPIATSTDTLFPFTALFRSDFSREFARLSRAPRDTTPALLPPAGEGGAKRRMRARAQRAALALASNKDKRQKQRFASLAHPHPPFEIGRAHV